MSFEGQPEVSQASEVVGMLTGFLLQGVKRGQYSSVMLTLRYLKQSALSTSSLCMIVLLLLLPKVQYQLLSLADIHSEDVLLAPVLQVSHFL